MAAARWDGKWSGVHGGSLGRLVAGRHSDLFSVEIFGLGRDRLLVYHDRWDGDAIGWPGYGREGIFGGKRRGVKRTEKMVRRISGGRRSANGDFLVAYSANPTN